MGGGDAVIADCFGFPGVFGLLENNIFMFYEGSGENFDIFFKVSHIFFVGSDRVILDNLFKLVEIVVENIEISEEFV